MDPRDRITAKVEIEESLKWLGWRSSFRRRIASAAVNSTVSHYDAGKRENSLRRAVKADLKEEFGSIWVMIVFTIVWEIIKRRLLS